MSSRPPPSLPRHANRVWWSAPHLFVVFYLIPMYSLLFALPKVFGPNVVIVKFRIYFDWYYYFLGLAFLLTFAAWAAIFDRFSIGYRPRACLRYAIAPAYLEFLAIATITAYAVWFHKLLLNPKLLLDIVTGVAGAVYATRLETQTISGATTATQFGLAYVTMYLHARWINAATLPRRFQVYFYALLGCAAFRAFGWAERLALIEILVPIVILYLGHRARPQGRFVRLSVAAAPVIGIVVLLVFFGVTEYFRSWSTYYRHQDVAYLDFVLSRVTSYYYTALNNGAALLDNVDWPNWGFEHVLQWLHRFPILVGPIFRFVIEAKQDQNFLRSYGDPEFNNLSGIFTVYHDLDIPGGLLFAALWGALMGFLYQGYRSARGIGVLLYPVTFIGVIEAMRILYLCSSRAFPALLAIAIGYALFAKPIRMTQDRQRTQPAGAAAAMPLGSR